ncbi:MAG: PAS domain-containing sensor histidine kinase, partial [Selenomonadaceae bacterium]|nr:PAS domain-containing sensor histidine kinase [Selenomonadaceae bacterium]
MSRTDFLGKKYLYEVLPMLKWFSEHVPGGFFIYSAKEPFKVLYVNSEVLNIYGCENLDEFRELTGYTFRGMVYPQDFAKIQESITEQIANPKNEKLDHVEYRITRKNGTVRWVDDYGHLSTFPEYGEAFYVFISDITERKEIQEDKQRMELELDKAKQANEVKAAFLFNISHDLLTPLNAIQGFTDLASRHLDNPELVRNYLQKVDESNRQLLGLVNELLDMSKVTYGKMHLRTEICDLSELVTNVVKSFEDAAAKKKIFVETKLNLPEELVYTDDVNLQKILSTLLDNAIKFTPEGGTVKVTAQKSKISESGYVRCEFTIEDTGVGMSKEFMSHMYESFERENTSTKSGHAGMGLGLAITKKLLDAMG